MPLFSSTNAFDQDIDKATSEVNTKEDWSLIMDICDRAAVAGDGKTRPAKDCLNSLVRRMHHQVPFVVLQALTVIDACVNNSGRAFHLEVASRDFIAELRQLLKKGHSRVQDKIKQLLKSWSDDQFKSDPALSLIPSLYQEVKKDSPLSFSDHTPAKTTAKTTTTTARPPSQAQEEDDLAKAIALSLKEAGKSSPKSGTSSSLYPSMHGTSGTTRTGGGAPFGSSGSGLTTKRQVRALYDFEAAEDNELTFKAGEIINIIDDSDAHWWKGSNQRGDGLFPANFVTADLSAEPENLQPTKHVLFNDEVQVKTIEHHVEPVTEINENEMERCLNLLQNADPTGDHPDPPELIPLEEQVRAMGPLIDQELHNIDKKSDELAELNTKLVDALTMYHELMKEFNPQMAYSSTAGMMPKQYGAGGAATYSDAMAAAQMGGQPMYAQQGMPQQYMPQQYGAQPQMMNMPPGQALPSNMAGSSIMCDASGGSMYGAVSKGVKNIMQYVGTASGLGYGQQQPQQPPTGVPGMHQAPHQQQQQQQQPVYQQNYSQPQQQQPVVSQQEPQHSISPPSQSQPLL